MAIIGVALGLIPTQPQNILAPRWIVGIAGVVFLACGFVPIAGRVPSPLLSNIMGAGTLLPLALIAHWVAFGSGTRQFSGSFNFGPFAANQPMSETPGRIVFGVGAILLDVLIVAIPVRLIRSRNRENS